MSTTIITNIVVDAPVEEVWSTLTDLPRHREWNPFITSASGTVALGERLTVTIQPPGGTPMTFRPSVTVVEPQERLEWLGRLGMRGVFDGRHSFTLTSMPGDRTLLQQKETFSGVLVPFTGRMLERTRAGFHAMNEALAARSSGHELRSDPRP